MGFFLAALPLLGQVAKVDIRATGTLTSEAILKGLLMTAYAGAGLDVPTEHMTVVQTTGSYVIEVDHATPSIQAQLDGYWCQNDPALRNAFSDLVGQTGITGLSDVTAVHTCVGATGTGCASSTVCGGGGGGATHDDDDSGGGSDPAPAPEPEPEGDEKDDDDDKLSTVAIVFIVIASVVAVALLLYLLWPWIETCCRAPTAQKLAEGQPVGREAMMTGVNVDLPPLYSPA